MGYTREYFIGFICFWASIITAFVLFHSFNSLLPFIKNELVISRIFLYFYIFIKNIKHSCEYKII